MIHSLNESHRAFTEAQTLMPGGVNSPARACNSVGAEPVFIAKGDGPFVEDIDGNRFLDLVGAFGPMILGHGHPAVLSAVIKQASLGFSFGTQTVAESELASKIMSMVPSIEKLRLVNSGTEATMSALRTARGFTGRHAIIKFEGCYHGHADCLLVKAGSGALTLGTPDSAGVTPGTTQDTLLATYNDLESVRSICEQKQDQIAAIIVEPIAGNMGLVPPTAGFLEGLRELATQHGAVLIFDEVMTGFRVHPGGAQGLYGVTPDLTCLGKIAGGGLPVGVYGGRGDIMACVAPEGAVYQAGTNSGNPLSVAAGLATLGELTADSGEVYCRLEGLSRNLEEGIRMALDASEMTGHIQRVGSMLTLFFTEGPVNHVNDVTPTAVERFGRFWNAMRSRGVMLPPSQYEAWFVSAAYTDESIQEVIEAATEALASMS
jgi:glutamate-1-semialdehyde 2,1-aminomutase